MKCPYCNQDSLYLTEGVVQTRKVINLEDDGGLIVGDQFDDYPDDSFPPYVRCENGECKRFLDDIGLHFDYVDLE